MYTYSIPCSCYDVNMIAWVCTSCQAFILLQLRVKTTFIIYHNNVTFIYTVNFKHNTNVSNFMHDKKPENLNYMILVWLICTGLVQCYYYILLCGNVDIASELNW